MTFGQIDVGDRFVEMAGSHIFQKTSYKGAIDLTEGPNSQGKYCQDTFGVSTEVMLRNNTPRVESFESMVDIPRKVE